MSSTPVYISTLLVRNIHCPSCVSYAKDVLHDIPGIHRIDISIVDHRIRIEHQGDISRQVAQSLLEAAFEVDHVTVTATSGQRLRAYVIKHDSKSLPPPVLTWRLFMSKAQRKHFENCNACREERKWTSLSQNAWQHVAKRRKVNSRLSLDSSMESGKVIVQNANSDEPETIGNDRLDEKRGERSLFSATFSIEGMTCASCVSTVTKEVKRITGVESVDVNLMANNAKIRFLQPTCTTEAIIQAIEDIGFEAELQDVHSVSTKSERTVLYRATISIEGMTCGSCVGTVTRGLQELSFIENVNVELVSNSATIVFQDQENVHAILEKVEDLGYEASIVNVEEQTHGKTLAQPEERKVEVEVAGMYCSRCPAIISSRLQEAFSDKVTILQDLNSTSSRMTLSYTPSVPALTIRSILRFLDSIDPAYSASVYHPPSLEERSRNIQLKDRNRILRHLFITFLVAIPSFVIGVVYMSLVPESNPTRQWFAEPIWAGSAMRMDWALFIMTTPVMFYGANIFHTRALKEIWSLWRPRSKVPILRRFYRFGSMNLLISAGTSVAYFASLAVLIMDATSSPMQEDDRQSTAQMKPRNSVTYFDTVTFLAFFILIGRFLEAYSKAKTGDAVSMLVNLRPSEALLVETSAADQGTAKKSTVTKIPVDHLEAGDTVSIPHGTCPPTDGIVDQEGNFLFDESSLTGESRPVKKVKGDKIYTGTVNVSDPVRLKVTEIGGKSMLDQIVNVVREGQAKRAPIERLADILTGYFTPVITLLAITTWIVWLSLGESGVLPQSWLDVDRGGWAFWSVEFAIAVFVVACPCGIGLAAPTALFVGGGLAAKHGILVQGGGEAFQEASKLDVIVFDKTGTLTEGKMKVTDVEYPEKGGADGAERAIAFALANALEESSTHPIAKAIAEYCVAQPEHKEIRFLNAEIKEVPGQGMTGLFKVQTVSGSMTYEALIGNERLLQSSAGSTTDSNKSEKTYAAWSTKQISSLFIDETLSRFQTSGCSTAIFAMHQKSDNENDAAKTLRPSLIFAIADPIRPEAPSVLSSLRSNNISVHMCTGDNQTTAHAIASQLGIPVSNIRAGVTPQEKATYIKELQYPDSLTTEAISTTNKPSQKSPRKIVAFVGDGTNDTPALTVSDVSIAISHSTSSDVALTSSSFILLNSSLDSILTLVTLSRRVFQRVKINFAWAAVYNVVLIPVAAGVFFAVGANAEHGGWRFSPVWASAAMAGSSVSVVLSSLALRLPEMRVERVLRRVLGEKKGL